jgi:ribosomal protein L3 glutamine methyltransferase
MQAHTPSLIDLIALSARRLVQEGCFIGHHYDNALDEARELVLFALYLPHDFPANYGSAAITAEEVIAVEALIEKRITQRVPASYLTGTAYFAGLAFHSDARALVPRSPIAELIRHRFGGLLVNEPTSILDLCTGSGCIGIACAHFFPNAKVVLADISADALALAQSNIARHPLQRRVSAIQSDLYANLQDQRFDLIVSNPPYVTDGDYQSMATEYRHEPKLGLTSGADGLDHPLRILQGSANMLNATGVLIMEIGDAWRALMQLLPSLQCQWLDFQSGHQMGILHITRDALVLAQADLDLICARRFG